MAFVGTAPGRAYSLGPVLQQRMNFTAASGDTSATLTFPSINRVESVLISTLQVKTIVYNGDNTCSITFTDPLATVAGVAEAHGV